MNPAAPEPAAWQLSLVLAGILLSPVAWWIIAMRQRRRGRGFVARHLLGALGGFLLPFLFCFAALIPGQRPLGKIIGAVFFGLIGGALWLILRAPASRADRQAASRERKEARKKGAPEVNAQGSQNENEPVARWRW
ncbi:MAG: hypothetical protein LBJ76_03025 [Candidatus Accumulibacter sp.]|jgi:hypothetical protein|nr:hypothetical protein [Accumulibacter sp.]